MSRRSFSRKAARARLCTCTVLLPTWWQLKLRLSNFKDSNQRAPRIPTKILDFNRARFTNHPLFLFRVDYSSFTRQCSQYVRETIPMTIASHAYYVDNLSCFRLSKILSEFLRLFFFSFFFLAEKEIPM